LSEPKDATPDDPLLIAVVNSENALHALSVETHYLAGGDVTGRKRGGNSAPPNVSFDACCRRILFRYRI
jgi:hypothetical protein